MAVKQCGLARRQAADTPLLVDHRCRAQQRLKDTQLPGLPLSRPTTGKKAWTRNTEPAELIAVFVADEGAQLTTFLE